MRDFPIKLESEAHEALSLLFHRDGVPNVMVMDDMGEGRVRDLNRGVGRQMLRSRCPKRFWDDCIIREAYVR
jgi:hypothetical protein